MKTYYNGKLIGDFYGKSKGEIVSELITITDKKGKPKYPDISKFTFDSEEPERDRQIQEFIYRHYPQNKQNSDLGDKIQFEYILKARGVENLEARLVEAVGKFYKGKTIEEIVNEIDDDDKLPYVQLLKVGIRIAWVQNCKAEYAKALKEGREMNLPDYPL